PWRRSDERAVSSPVNRTLLSPARGRGWERGLHELSEPPLLASPPSGGEESEEAAHRSRRVRQVAQHVVQHAAVLEVLDLLGGIDAAGEDHRLLGAVAAMDGERHVHADL